MSESPADPDPAAPEADRLLDELRKLKVGDVLAHTCSMLASLAYGKLAPETRDLEEVRLAIEALRALQPFVPEDDRPSIQQVVANLQLAYAEAARAE